MLLALSMALSALGIDTMLPALGDMRQDLGLPAASNSIAMVITTFYLGLAFGQLVYGPLADRYGRRPVLFASYSLYTAGALASALAPSLALLLVMRFVWGAGAAGARVVVLAVIRDSYQGDAMARTMSLVMATFLLTPIVAPSIGHAVVSVTTWRWLFIACALVATVTCAWAWRSLPETLDRDRRIPLRPKNLARALSMIAADRRAVGYTLAAGCLYGSFTSYLTSAEAIISDIYNQADRFSLIFGGLSLALGAAMVVNGRVVERFSAARVARSMVMCYAAAGAALLVASIAYDGRPPLHTFLVIMAVICASQSLVVPNSMSIAMASMGAIAGTASSVMGASHLAAGALIGSFVGGLFNGTMFPLAWACFTCPLLAALLMRWADGAPGACARSGVAPSGTG